MIKYQPRNLTALGGGEEVVFVWEAKAFSPWNVVRETQDKDFGRGCSLESGEKKQEQKAGLFFGMRNGCLHGRHFIPTAERNVYR